MKLFWLFAALNAADTVIRDILFEKGPDWIGYIIDAIFLVFMYNGYIWTWYFFAGAGVIVILLNAFVLTKIIPEMHWIVHIWPEKAALGVVRTAVSMAMCSVVIFGKDLKYFVEVKQAERKKKSGGQTVKKEKSGER